MKQEKCKVVAHEMHYFMKAAALIYLAVLTTGCVKSTQIYDGAEAPREYAVLSSIWLWPESRVSVRVAAINRELVDMERTSEFLMPPGKHIIWLRLSGGRGYELSGQYLRVLQEAGTTVSDVAIEFDFKALHSYIPRAWIADNKVSLGIVDMGQGFNIECMPLRKAVRFFEKNPAGDCPVPE